MAHHDSPPYSQDNYQPQHANGAAGAPQTRQVPQALTVVAPRPGYAPQPISALDGISRPEQAAMRSTDYPFQGMGGGPGQSSSPLSVPNSPHPLNPPISPITPVFARGSPLPRPVKFQDAEPIMRGNKEETLLPRRGERGDDFWRRFSMVVKDEAKTGTKESSWLQKTRNGNGRLSRWVWVIGLILVLVIAGVSVLGWYFTRDEPDHQRPGAFGGHGEQTAPGEGPTAPVLDATGGTSRMVQATHTVARRAEPTSLSPLLDIADRAASSHQAKRSNSNKSRHAKRDHLVW